MGSRVRACSHVKFIGERFFFFPKAILDIHTAARRQQITYECNWNFLVSTVYFPCKSNETGHVCYALTCLCKIWAGRVRESFLDSVHYPWSWFPPSPSFLLFDRLGLLVFGQTGHEKYVYTVAKNTQMLIMTLRGITICIIFLKIKIFLKHIFYY